MYKVYLDDELMYSPLIKELSLVNAKVTTELNATGTFDFSVLDTNVFYSKIKKMKSIVKVYDDSTRIFRGRVYKQTRAFYNKKEIICEGELAFLLDSLQRPYDFQGSPEELFRMLIENHNKRVSPEKQFKVGRCTVTDPNDYITRSDTQYLTTWDSLQEKLIKPLGGYLWTREEADGVYIDYLADFDTLNPQTVEFAKNLLDFEEIIKGKDLATVIIPVGCRVQDEEGNETGERLTIESVNNGIDYVLSEEAVEKFGWIEKVVFFDDVTLPSNLIKKGREELQNRINLLQSIQLTAVDLHAINREIRSFQVGSYTRVISKPHGVSDLYLTRRRVINLFNAADGVLQLGDENQTFIDQFEEQNKKYDQIVDVTYEVKSDYDLNKEKVHIAIENLQKTIKVELTANFGAYQKKDQQGSLNPDYEETPLIITPVVWFKGKQITSNVSYVWKRKVSGTEMLLISGESVSADGTLTVSNNLTESTRYICYATYTVSETEKYVANAYLDFTVVADGDNGKDGVWMCIESTEGFIFDSSISSVLTARIYEGETEVDPDGAFTYTWYGRSDGDWEVIGAGKTITLSSLEEHMRVYFEADGEGVRYVLTDNDGNYLIDNEGNRLVV